MIEECSQSTVHSAETEERIGHRERYRNSRTVQRQKSGVGIVLRMQNTKHRQHNVVVGEQTIIRVVCSPTTLLLSHCSSHHSSIFARSQPFLLLTFHYSLFTFHCPIPPHAKIFLTSNHGYAIMLDEI